MTCRRIHPLLILGAALLAILGSAAALAQRIDPSQPTVLITGSSRGIGLAFAEHYAAAGWNVIATARAPQSADELQALAAKDENVVIEQLDVTDYARITELAAEYAGTPIDVLINNAGVYGDRDKQEWGSLDPEAFAEVNAVNVLGPLKMAEAFADHVAASRQKKIVSITSGAGSVSPDRVRGGGIYYAISKAALNMAMRKARAELEGRGIIVAAIAPGMVHTDMLATNRPSLVPRAKTAEESVASIAEVIASLDHTYDGRPRNYDGTALPW
ncbi:MAG TPA: SDR family oxidoreductase [Gammaproteobacteria bacterium]|nr:SDR family oxidoreductase [Gammaproteobacteria bacterium]